MSEFERLLIMTLQLIECDLALIAKHSLSDIGLEKYIQQRKDILKIWKEVKNNE